MFKRITLIILLVVVLMLVLPTLAFANTYTPVDVGDTAGIVSNRDGPAPFTTSLIIANVLVCLTALAMVVQYALHLTNSVRVIASRGAPSLNSGNLAMGMGAQIIDANVNDQKVGSTGVGWKKAA